MSADQLVVGFDLDMTLIDTAPGLPRRAGGAGRRARRRVPGRGDDRQLGPPLDLLLEPYLAADAIAAAGDRFRALYPDHAIAGTPALRRRPRGARRRTRHGGRVVVVTGKYPANAQLHLDHLAFDVDHLEGWVWGVGKADVLRREGASIYVGDHVHDVEGALAAGALSVSVLTGGCTREELVAAGTHVVLDDLAEFPAWLDEHLLDLRLAALEADLRERGSVLVAYSGGADSAFLLAAAVRALGRRAGRRRDRLLPLAAAWPSATRPASSPSRSASEVLTPETHEMEREGYRANAGDRCYFCKAELLDVLAPLAAERGPRPRRDRHQRRRRRRRLPPGHPGRRRARRDHPAPRRRAHQGAGPRGVAPLGAADLGQARRRLPLLAGRVRRRGHPAPARPGRARRGRRRARCWPTPALVNLRVRDLGDRASVEVDAALLPLPAEAERGRLLDAVRRGRLRRGRRSTPADSVRDR